MDPCPRLAGPPSHSPLCPGLGGRLSSAAVRVIDVGQPVGADQRLYGMMQHLMAAYADQQAPEKPDPRGVVELQDALDAMIQVAAVIDEETRAGRVPAVRGQHAAAMLMRMREYIQPLPRPGRGRRHRPSDDRPRLHGHGPARGSPGQWVQRLTSQPAASSHGEIGPAAPAPRVIPPESLGAVAPGAADRTA
jgi:hypothetical protein